MNQNNDELIKQLLTGAGTDSDIISANVILPDGTIKSFRMGTIINITEQGDRQVLRGFITEQNADGSLYHPLTSAQCEITNDFYHKDNLLVCFDCKDQVSYKQIQYVLDEEEEVILPLCKPCLKEREKPALLKWYEKHFYIKEDDNA